MIGKDIPVPPGLKEEPIDHAVEIIAKQFAGDKVQRYILLEDLAKAGRKEVDYGFNKEVFSSVIPDMVKNGGRCLTVQGSGIASVWNLHAVTETYHPVPGHPVAVTELNIFAYEARKPRVPPHCKGILHLFLLANDRSHPSNDASRNAKVSDVVRPMMQIARENDWTIALEATSEKSRDIYQHLGFGLVKELTIGIGKVDSEGREKEGGEGVRLWVMMTPV